MFKVGLTDLWPTVKGRRGRYHLAILELNDSWAPVGEEVYVMSDALTVARLSKTNPKIKNVHPR